MIVPFIVLDDESFCNSITCSMSGVPCLLIYFLHQYLIHVYEVYQSPIIICYGSEDAALGWLPGCALSPADLWHPRPQLGVEEEEEEGHEHEVAVAEHVLHHQHPEPSQLVGAATKADTRYYC